MSTAEKLTPAQIGQHFREAYDEVSPGLHNWEKAKAVLLVMVGQKCLDLVRQSLEPMADHDLTGRKNARATLIKQIEAALPEETEGIGAPQVNRWIRWAGACGLLRTQENEPVSLGLRQSHLMVLERILEQNEGRAEFRLKGPWQTRLAEIQGAVRSAVESSAAASDLEAALDKLAVLTTSAPAPAPKPTEPKPTGAQPPQSLATKPSSKPEAQSAPSPTAQPAPAPPPATKAAPKASSPGPSAPSPVPSASRPAPATAPPCPADLADQAFKLLQNPEILAGVFRREWKPQLLKDIVENLIRANGEQVDNAHALAVAYHRAKPFILTYYEEYAADGKFKLRRKEEPESPTLEQLVPGCELTPA